MVSLPNLCNLCSNPNNISNIQHIKHMQTSMGQASFGINLYLPINESLQKVKKESECILVCL